MLGGATELSKQEGIPVPLYGICDDAYEHVESAVEFLQDKFKASDFEFVVRMRRDTPDNDREIWEASTQVAWALRLADSERQDGTNPQRQERGAEVYTRISQIVNENPHLGTYLAFQLLSDTWQTEEDILETYPKVKLNSISDELHNLAFGKLLEGVQRAVQTTEMAPEIAMLEQVIQRAYEHLDLQPIENLLNEEHELPNTYLKVKDVILLSKLADEVWHNKHAVAALKPAQKVIARLKEHERLNKLFVSDISAE